MPHKKKKEPKAVEPSPAEPEQSVAEPTPQKRKAKRSKSNTLRSGEAGKANKPKRKGNAYSEFVKKNYDSVRDHPVKERFKILAEMWKKEKAKKK